AAFTCDARFYQLRQDPLTLLSNLYVLDRRNLAAGGAAQWASGFGPGLNALAFNKADGYSYAVNITPFASGNPFRLYRLGTSGAVEVGSATLGLPTGSSIAAATIDASGTMYIKKLVNDAVIYKYTIGSGAPSTLNLGSSIVLADLAMNPVDGFLYGVSTPGGVYRINASTGATTLSGSPAGAAGDGSNVLGSAYFDVAGTLYASQNGGTYGTVNLGTGAFTTLATGTAAAPSDGASCVYPDNRLDVVKSAGSVTANSTTSFDIPYTVAAKNTGTVSDPNVQLTENLAQTFSAGSPTLSIVSGPTVTSGTATVNSAFTGTGDTRLLSGTTALASGAGVTVTFTVRAVYPNAASVPSAAINNSVTATSTSTAPNDGTSSGGLPPIDLLATDTSSNAAAPPASANGDTPTPTPVTLPTVADLTLTKTDGVNSVSAGGATTYTITLTNAGPGSANSTVLTDPAASGLSKTVVSCVAAGGATCPTITTSTLESGVTIATLPSGGSITLTVPVAVTAIAGAVSNSVTATLPAGTVDLTPTGTVTDTDTVTPVTDVAISKAVSRAYAGPGQTLTYIVKVWNNGPNVATGATITDTVPATLSGVTWTCAATGTATCGTASGSGNTISLSATLPVDPAPITTPDTQYVTVTVTGTLAATATGTVGNTAAVAHASDTTGGNNSAAATTAIVDAVNDSAVSVPFSTAATITVLGNDTVGGIAATTSNTLVTISANGGLSGLSVNASGQLVVPSSAPAGTYTVTYRLCDATVGTACDTATVPITIGAAQAHLKLTKTGPTYAQPTQDITYTLTVTNAGPDTATTLTVTDTLPAGLTYKSSSPAASVSGQTLTWTATSLANAGTWTITVTASTSDTVTLESTPAVRTLTNQASVSSATADPVSGNNAASAVTAVVYGKLSKKVRNVTSSGVFGTSGQGLPGEVLEYCIDYGNYGGVALPNFAITDHVPGNTAALTTAYDADEPSTATGFGVKLVRGAVTSYLTSAADADTGVLSSSGGTYSRGTMSAALGSLGVGESGSACFQVAIR
ncbi:DUF11 domain-containing protein, partial [Deinococcus sp.]|uniref:beta strand repeat-containing protein n=1 Tax=Deinococcus sp. TaxID=47478 RepID=UPI00286982A4